MAEYPENTAGSHPDDHGCLARATLRIEPADELASDRATHLYYSANWQVLEERLDSSSNAHAQYVWGLGYVNDLVPRDRDADSNSGTGGSGKSSSGLEERLYAEQDANYNVTSLTNTSGEEKVERKRRGKGVSHHFHNSSPDRVQSPVLNQSAYA